MRMKNVVFNGSPVWISLRRWGNRGPDWGRDLPIVTEPLGSLGGRSEVKGGRSEALGESDCVCSPRMLG